MKDVNQMFLPLDPHLTVNGIYYWNNKYNYSIIINSIWSEIHYLVSPGVA